jgi:predicted O-methyltransferase YrrM
MSRPHVPHAFTAVDSQPQPAQLVHILRRLAAEPFYGAYKRRLRDLLRARPGGRFLDVGAGAGDSALALAAESGAARWKRSRWTRPA